MSTTDLNRPATDTSGPATDPEERQRQEIQTTRADVGRTLGRLEDRVSPSRIKQRQTDRLKGRWQDLRESVMGSDDGDGSEWRSRLEDVREGVEDAPEHLEDATRGNPLAAGMIAFGFGALAGSLLPASEPERRIATQLREEFEQPLREELQDSGRELGDRMGDRAQEAADEVRDTAKDAVQRTTDDTRQAAERVRDDAKEQAGGQASDGQGMNRPQSPGMHSTRREPWL